MHPQQQIKSWLQITEEALEKSVAADQELVADEETGASSSLQQLVTGSLQLKKEPRKESPSAEKELVAIELKDP